MLSGAPPRSQPIPFVMVKPTHYDDEGYPLQWGEIGGSLAAVVSVWTNRVVSAPQKNNEPFPRQTIMKSATTSYSTARGSHPAMCCATPTASKLVTGWVFAG